MIASKLGRRDVLSGSLACLSIGKCDAGRGIGRSLFDGVLVDKASAVAEADVCHAPFRAAFQDWLHASSERFALPIIPDVTSPSHTMLRLRGVHPAIWISLQNGVNVGVEWDGVFWDLILSLDAYEKPVLDGTDWMNEALLEQYQTVHPSPESLWRADVFEQMLTWINQDLALATHLALWGINNDDVTWARLVRGDEILGMNRAIQTIRGKPTHLLPIHGHST